MSIAAVLISAVVLVAFTGLLSGAFVWIETDR